MTRFQTITELRLAIANNPNLGLIGGNPVIDSSSKEIRKGFVTKALYNQTLLIGGTMGFNKSDIGKAALLLLQQQWSSMKVTGLIESTPDLGDETSNREFRYFVGQEILDSLGSIPIVLTNSQLTAIALTVWGQLNDQYYQSWMQRKIVKTQHTQSQIEQAIFDKWKMEAWLKRLTASDRKGELVQDKKLS